MLYLRLLFCCIATLGMGILGAQVPDSLQKVRSGTVLAPQLDTVPPFLISGVAVDSLNKDSSALASIDSTRRTNIIRRFFTKKYPNPRKAALLSLVLPGAGQAYNKKWWKIPIVWGTLGGLTWWEFEKIAEYRLYRDNYRYAVDGDPATNVTDPRLIRLDATTLKSNRAIAQQNVQYTSIVLALAYLFTATDAFVDAHMSYFDVSDDLSLRIIPKTQMTTGFGPSFGMAVSVNLH